MNEYKRKTKNSERVRAYSEVETEEVQQQQQQELQQDECTTPTSRNMQNFAQEGVNTVRKLAPFSTCSSEEQTIQAVKTVMVPMPGSTSTATTMSVVTKADVPGIEVQHGSRGAFLDANVSRLNIPSSLPDAVASSTPAGSPVWMDRRSPILPYHDVSDEIYTTTPIAQSMGTSLIARPSPIHVLPAKPSVLQMESCITNLTDHIEHFRARFRDKEGWMYRIQEQSDRYSGDLDVIQARAVDISSMPILAKCFNLRAVLKKYTEELEASANELRQDPSRGQPSLREPAFSAVTVCVDRIADELTQNDTLLQVASGVPPGATGQWNMQVETRPVDVNGQGNGDLLKKIEELETNVTNLWGRINLVEKNLTSSVSQIDLAVNDQNSKLAAVTENIKVLDDKLVGNTLACQQYELIASGVVADNMQLKKQFQTLLSRMNNLTDQVNGVGRRLDQTIDAGMIVSEPVTSTIASEARSTLPGITSLCQPRVLQPGNRIVSTSCIMSTGVSSQPIGMHEGYCQPNTTGFGNFYQFQPSSLNCPPTFVLLVSAPAEARQQLSQSEHEPSQNSASLHGSEGSSSSLLGMEHLSREGKRLKKMSRNLKRMLTPAISEDIPKATLQDIYKSTVITVDSERKELSKALDRYEKSVRFDHRLCDEVEDIIEDASNWTTGMREMHRSLGYHKQSLNKKLYENLQKFSSQSDVNIFEFLRRFELYTEETGSPMERAELLYNSYLDDNVKLELVSLSKDYEAMKRKLLKKFGDLTIITDNIVRVIAKEQMPQTDSSYSVLTDYYRKLNSVVHKIGELQKSVDVPLHELKEHIYSAEFLSKLLKFVPDVAKNNFMDQMLAANEDVTTIKGQFAFSMLTLSISNQFTKYDSLSRTEESYLRKNPVKKDHSVAKQKKSAHAVVSKSCDDDSDCEETVPAVTVSHQNTKSKPQQSTTGSGRPPRFPCVLAGHKHDVGECLEFFSKSPAERFNARKTSGVKVCLTCLRDPVNCKNGVCANLKSVPDKLICTECKDIAKKNQKSPFNVLFCRNKNHTRPDDKDVVQSLDKMMKFFIPAKVQAPINLAAHLKIVGLVQRCKKCKSECKCRPKSLSSKVDPTQPIPAINTETGEIITVPEDDVVTEVEEDCMFVMQTLNLDGKDVLTFYDRGANQHLIDGQLAESISLKVVNDEPVIVGIVGGGRIWTEYGSYRMSLGPTPDGKYHEITAQGFKHVTDKFPRYNLKELNKELRRSLDIGANVKLPKTVGGMRAGLLIGIKDTLLEPVCVFHLPSGVLVDRSLLKDKFGSRYCYGGPHKLFTEANRQTHGDVNHINVYFTQMVNQYRNSLYPILSEALEPEMEEGECGMLQISERQPVYSYLSKSGVPVFPTALTDRDMTELGKSTTEEIADDQVDCPAVHCCCDVKIPGLTPQSSVHKAKIALSKQREFIDEDDMDNTVNFRCSECQRCKCSTSNRTKMMSLVEKIEQEVIQKSVTIDLENKKVFVDLPFTKPPVEFLKKKHFGKDNNYDQALKVYRTQCRKSSAEKQGMREVHADLVERGFLRKMSDLSPEDQSIIAKNGFKHYMPWRLYLKDSKSTPVRFVVDASMSGLNLILAKGENVLSRINDILVRSRTKRHLWSTDISKLYNQLHLNPTSYPYALLLFGDEMNVDVEPEVWVMVVAWYGVTSTGNQSGHALEELAGLLRTKNPHAYDVLVNDRYVDDILSGGTTGTEVNQQIKEVQEVLSAGGFQTKYIVKSGEKPNAIASSDGESVKVLGYRWATEDDQLGPGFAGLNFNKKQRGMKKPNPFPVVDPSDVTKLLSSTKISRRMVVSKMAEIWDPVGLWEPYKLQLKLESQMLNGLDWDIALDAHLQEHWTKRFQEFLDIPNMSAERCIVPDDAVNPGKMRLLCISDAAVNAGGCAIYGGFKRPNGQYSCRLLTSKSRIMGQSIPRNELEGVRLAANMALDVKHALGDLVEDVLFFTDSTIAMCWVHNTHKKLRLFCLNRVTEIRRLIEATVGEVDDFPVYHIDGKLNVADMLTKPHGIKPSDLGVGSVWQNGKAWMTRDLSSMPITRFSDLSVARDDEEVVNMECFPEIQLQKRPTITIQHAILNPNDKDWEIMHCMGCVTTDSRIPMNKCYGLNGMFTHCIGCSCRPQFSSFRLEAGKGSQMLVDIIKFGWIKSLRILAVSLRFIWLVSHKVHKFRGVENSQTCKMCCAITGTGGVKEEIWKILQNEAKNYFSWTFTGGNKM